MNKILYLFALIFLGTVSEIYDSVFCVEPILQYHINPLLKEYQVGNASWYGLPFHGRKTASGEVYNQHGVSAAHRRLPLGSIARVTNLDNGNFLFVRINDRGPHINGRIIDLSLGAAKRLGIKQKGIQRVKIDTILRSRF